MPIPQKQAVWSACLLLPFVWKWGLFQSPLIKGWCELSALMLYINIQITVSGALIFKIKNVLWLNNLILCYVIPIDALAIVLCSLPFARKRTAIRGCVHIKKWSHGETGNRLQIQGRKGLSNSNEFSRGDQVYVKEGTTIYNGNITEVEKQGIWVSLDSEIEVFLSFNDLMQCEWYFK